MGDYGNTTGEHVGCKRRRCGLSLSRDGVTWGVGVKKKRKANNSGGMCTSDLSFTGH